LALLEIQNLSKSFPGVRALEGVSLSVDAGEIHAICGENGAGKSTLLKILSGVHPYGSYEGEILWEGSSLRLRGPRQAEHAGIALVAQELNLVPALSIAENLFLGHERKKGWRMDWEASRDQAKEAFTRVGLDEDPETPAEALSIGKQQLAEISRALNQNARLLILDEPTAALTEADAERLLGLVEGIAKAGTAILYVSHRLDEVFRIAKTITVLRDGKSIRSASAKDWSRPSVVSAMVGRELKENGGYQKNPKVGAEPALQIRSWTVGRPGAAGKLALDRVGLDLRKGEILGLAGLMGSGRTALLSTLFGDWRAEGEGELRLGDGPWREPFRSPEEALAAGICLASEDRKRQGLVGPASVAENLALASLRRFASGLRLRWPELSAAAEEQRQVLQIKTPSLSAEVLTLSGGNQQKVVFGRLMMLGPGILLLDEPTRGIDVGAKAEIHRLIRELAAKGIAVLLASSDLPELLELSDRIFVLSQGKFAGQLEGKGMTPEAVMHAATAA
jgi:D-xylose transport system ATP-binding protein